MRIEKRNKGESSVKHMIGIEVVTESCYEIPYLKIPRKGTFITGEKYKLNVKIRNMDSDVFPGGNFRIWIHWPICRMLVSWDFSVGALAPNEIIKTEYGKNGITDVLDSGPALFFARGLDIRQQPINFCDIRGNSLAPQRWGTHVHTIIPKRAEELYQFWALVVAIIAFSPILIEGIYNLLQWMNKLLTL